MTRLMYKFYPYNMDTETPSCTDTEIVSVSVLLTVLVHLPRSPAPRTASETCTDNETPVYRRKSKENCNQSYQVHNKSKFPSYILNLSTISTIIFLSWWLTLSSFLKALIATLFLHSFKGAKTILQNAWISKLFSTIFVH